MGESERQLDALLQAYRTAVPDPEASANFMPLLWERIEARRRSSLRLARFFVTAAVVASVIMGVFLAVPSAQSSLVYSATYLDVLDAAHSSDTLAYTGITPEQASDLSVQ